MKLGDTLAVRAQSGFPLSKGKVVVFGEAEVEAEAGEETPQVFPSLGESSCFNSLKYSDFIEDETKNVIRELAQSVVRHCLNFKVRPLLQGVGSSGRSPGKSTSTATRGVLPVPAKLCTSESSFPHNNVRNLRICIDSTEPDEIIYMIVQFALTFFPTLLTF